MIQSQLFWVILGKLVKNNSELIDLFFQIFAKEHLGPNYGLIIKTDSHNPSKSATYRIFSLKLIC
uniref:Uncharacterized protein n=1 Tax=Romanomermis culicivorax TaxID=13658 RepID=A0A915HNT6_ROMCU